MTDELDLLTRARDRLIELDQRSSISDPAPWKAVNGMSAAYAVENVKGATITWDDHAGEVFGVQTAMLIVALRGCVPYLIERLERSIRLYDRNVKIRLPVMWEPELNLARAILGETEGQNNG